MFAIKKARKLIESDPESKTASILSALVVALETNASYQLGNLYELDYDNYELAIDIIKDWRLDRHYASKVKLLSAAIYVDDLKDVDNLKNQPVNNL